MALDDLAYGLSIWAVPGLLAVTLHEAAHGWTAFRLGDDTALRLGRVSFNPVRHVDPVGTVILPTALFLVSGLIFGWAKPVPIAFHQLRHPRRDMVLVAAAGPAVNLLLACLSIWLSRWVWLAPGPAAAWLGQMLHASALINMILAIFNMLPLPPLDGGRIAVGLLPDRLALPLARMERYGLVLLLGLFLAVPPLARMFGVVAHPLTTLVLDPAQRLIAVLARLMAVG